MDRVRGDRHRRFNDRARILSSGALAATAIVVAVILVLRPFAATRDDLRRIGHDGLPLQGQLVALRTTVADWQFFIEPNLNLVTPNVAPDPNELIKGGDLVKALGRQTAALAQHLERIGMRDDARDLTDAMGGLNRAITQLTPIAEGKPVAAATLRRLVSAERDNATNVWALTTALGTRLSQQVTNAQVEQAGDHVVLGMWFFLIGVGIDFLIVVVATAVVGARAGRRERERRHVERLHEYESRVQRALEMTKAEPDVYEIIGTALHESVPELKIELLIADSSRAHFRRALTNDGDFEGCGVVSPLDCPAATDGQTLMFPSSRALDACPYLKDRPSGACSAACVPVSIAGHAVGVTHAVGPDGVLPSAEHVDMLGYASRRGSERIGMIRAFETSESQASTDPLTGLLNRRSLENRVRDMQREQTPYSLAYGDLDHFKVLNDLHGHETGDQALRAFSRVLRDAVRPNDIVARYGGEEFVIVLPDCDTEVAVGVLERVRERLALALRSGRVPSFTVTFGVASTAYAANFDEIVAIADSALLAAKGAGRNRVLVADLPVAPEPVPAATDARPSE